MKNVKEIEKALIQIFSNALGINFISVNDNFFDLGLDSLKCIMTTIKIKEYFELELPMGIIYKNQTIRSLAKEIYNIKNEGENA